MPSFRLSAGAFSRQLLAVIASLSFGFAHGAVINEIRIDQPGSDVDEYFELVGLAGESLDGVTYLVIGDGTTGSGTVESVTPLDGAALGPDGLLVAAEASFTLATADVTAALGFENSDNVTHVLVTGFTGALGDDLDTNDDGVLDVLPWASVLDAVSLVETPASGDAFYGAALGGQDVGPDGTFVPAYVCRAGSRFVIGPFDPVGGEDTPGAPNTCVAPDADVVINELRIDQPGSDVDEYFELAGAPGDSLSGLTYLVIGDGVTGAGTVESVTSLDGLTLDSDGLALVAESSFTLGTADLTATLGFENSDNVTHVLASGFSGALGDDLDTNDDGVLDVLPWTSVLDAVSLVETPGSGDPFYASALGGSNVGPDGTFVPGYVCRDGDVFEIGPFDPIGGDDTPGAPNVCGGSGPQAVFIHEVQGSGPDVALTGLVEVQAVVTSLFEDNDLVEGFFMQEEDADADADPATSEGIFVFCNQDCPTDLAAGDTVTVVGTPEDFFGMSQIDTEGAAGSVTIETGASGVVTPTAVTLPAAGATTDAATFENLEGMLVAFPDKLVVSEYFQLSRFGQVVLTVDERPRQFTDANPPSVEGYADFLEDLATQRIILDDLDNDQNEGLVGPEGDEPYPYPDGGFSITNFFRGGDSVTGLTGVLHWSFAGASGTNAWRVRPVPGETYAFAAENPRAAAPAEVGGRLKVASFNVLNYFTTIDEPGAVCGPSSLGCRGANSAAELTRQTDKIVAALAALDADVVGLVEIENNASASVAALVDALNAATGEAYGFIDTGDLGGDAIKVAFIYDTASVAPVGDFAVLDSSVDARFIDTKNRPMLAQTFLEQGANARFTAVVGHLKSKGSSCDDVGDANANDGQGNCNGTRTLATQALADWLATDPTSSGDEDFLIIGDLNAYAMEDPITTLEMAGYTDLIEQFEGAGAYSFVFDGQLGYLDHALGNAPLTAQVTGVAEWHINADEVNLLDYNDGVEDPGERSFERKSNALPLYSPDAYRSSDHDPVLVGLALTPSFDVNNDGCVDWKDQAAVRVGAARQKAFGEYDLKLDLNGDGVVSSLDVELVIANFSLPKGQPCQAQPAIPKDA